MEALLVLVPLGLYLFFFGMFGIYTAEQAGRTNTEGFWYAVLLGPFGIIALACLPRLPDQEPVPLMRPKSHPPVAPTPAPNPVTPPAPQVKPARVVLDTDAPAPPAKPARPRPGIARKPWED